MNRSHHLTLILSSCFLAAGSRAAAQEPKPESEQPKSVETRLDELEKKVGGDFMRGYWKDGLRFETADKRYKFKLGGRIHYDVAYSGPDDETRAGVERDDDPTTPAVNERVRIDDGSEIRRARLELSGEVGDAVEWATSFDFGGGSTNFRNVYAGVKERFFGASLRAGQFKEPYGLEQLTSSNNITFLERSLMNAFVPAFNAGLMAYDALAGERLTWALGAFRTGISDSGEVSNGDGEWAGTARITGLPFVDEAGDDYVHLGLSFSRRSPTADSVTFSSKPESNLAPSYVSAKVAAETVQLLGAEAAWVRGPFSLSGEYTRASIDAPPGSGAEPGFSGHYVQAGYFLTGESRGYKKAQGCFDTLKPKENAFGAEDGCGAWEVALRLSGIDLEDMGEGVRGGVLGDLTLGVNWYLNPNTRVMANYVRADLDPRTGASGPDLADGDTSILELRVQFAF